MIEYIILAILQGLFEWFPISSSGQVMIVAIIVFGITADEAYSLSIFLHLGTMFAVLLKFRKDFLSIFKSFTKYEYEGKSADVKRRNWVVLGTIGTAITALPLYFIFKALIIGEFTALQGDLITLIITGLLILTGTILLLTKRMFGINTLDDVSNKEVMKDGFLAGLIQGLAVLPGISRSGITTSAILFEKYEQNSALKLSFMMAVPAIIGSIFVDIIFAKGSVFGFLDIFTIILITLISFIVGYLTMDLLLKIAKKVGFNYFCIIYGIIAFAVIIPVLILT
ncbi:MAG TPA: undecaprenyl-diphosphate phosphatase [Candidatus Lokiarchaeia archaeon]